MPSGGTTGKPPAATSSSSGSTSAAGSTDIVRYIESQFSVKPEGIGVDVVFGGGTDPYLYLKGKGLLAPYRLPPAILESHRPRHRGPLASTTPITPGTPPA